MPLTQDDIRFDGREPAIAASLPVAEFADPCLTGTDRPTRVLADALELDIAVSVPTPTGFMAAGKSGQIEHFAASGGIRARSTERMTRFEDERRAWPDVREVDGPDGRTFELGRDTQAVLMRQAEAILRKAELADDAAHRRVAVERWAELDGRGREVTAGVGRATVAVTYEAAGVPLIGPGAKTNLHFDPQGQAVELVRFFHVNRAAREIGEIRTIPLEQSLQPLLEEAWTSRGVNPDEAKIVIVDAVVGLLTLPAHVPQSHALPALAVQGFVQGDLGGLEEIRFARYLPLFDRRHAARLGVATPLEAPSGPYEPDEARTRPPRNAA